MPKTDRKHVKQRWTAEQDGEILMMKSNGQTEQQIAERTGRTFNSIRDRLKRLAKLGARSTAEVPVAQASRDKAVRDASAAFAGKLPGHRT